MLQLTVASGLLQKSVQNLFIQPSKWQVYTSVRKIIEPLQDLNHRLGFIMALSSCSPLPWPVARYLPIYEDTVEQCSRPVLVDDYRLTKAVRNPIRESRSQPPVVQWNDRLGFCFHCSVGGFQPGSSTPCVGACSVSAPSAYCAGCVFPTLPPLDEGHEGTDGSMFHSRQT